MASGIRNERSLGHQERKSSHVHGSVYAKALIRFVRNLVEGYVTLLQESTQFMFISIPSLLAIGFIAALVLYLLGQRKAGIILFGLMIIVTPLLWYGSFAMHGSIVMTIADILILSLLSSIGGIIIGVGLQYESGPRQGA